MKQPFKKADSKLSWVKPSLKTYGTVQQMTEGSFGIISPNGSVCPDGTIPIGMGKCIEEP